VKDTLRDLGYTIRDPDKAETIRATAGRTRRREAAPASRRWGLHRRCRADGLDDRRDGALRIGLARDGSVTLGLALGTMFGPGRYITEKAFQSLRRGIFNQHVLPEAGAFAGLLGGLLGLFVFPSFPTVHFFAVSVFITTYHILSEYTSLIVRTRASQAVQSLSISSRTRPVASPTTEMLRTFLSTTSQSETRYASSPVKNVPVDGVVGGGKSTVDESVATGESIPEEKDRGRRGYRRERQRDRDATVEVTAIGDDAFLNQVAREIEEARAMKLGIITADRVLSTSSRAC